MPRFAVGIDTGGTFTDGVVYDVADNEVVTKTKVVTTRSNLTTAVGSCLDNLIGKLEKSGKRKEVLSSIAMVCLSTTLATNAIVEGQGAEVGLLLIGIDIEKELPTPHIHKLRGGYDIQGREKEPLDLEAVASAIESSRDKVEAFAVSGYMSVRNPEQELAAARLVDELTGYPFVCGHQLSGDLGAYERTVTAILNARLIPLVARLIAAVKENLETKKIDAPLMVVKGDGSLISEAVARERPIETILSGPAASLIGAKVLSNVHEGLIVDMGGTTTDIAVLKNDRPMLNDEGAVVGGWLTHVKAAEITTIGLGGDSIIAVTKNGQLIIGPQRVFPLSWSVSEHPHLLEELQIIEENRLFFADVQPTCTLFFIQEPKNVKLTPAEASLIELVRLKPHTLFTAARKLGKDVGLLPWKRLVNMGVLHRANLTPTDILHARGAFTQWSTPAAFCGVRIMARRYGTDPESFMEIVEKKISYRLFTVLIEKMARIQNREITLPDSKGSVFILEALHGAADKSRALWGIELYARLTAPLIAVGAPAEAYFPEVIKHFSGELLVPKDADVANAVGTVNGKVAERVRILVKPGETGGFFVYGPEGRKIFTQLNEAVNYGEELGRNLAQRRAVAAGGYDIQVTSEVDKRFVSLSRHEKTDSKNDLFLECRIDNTAEGRPWREKA